MIYQDEFGFPVDQTGDGGDSAVRAGILSLFGNAPSKHLPTLTSGDSSTGNSGSYLEASNERIRIEAYENNGVCVRCPSPTQSPWNSPLNFSRDQLIPLASGLPAAAARRVFWSHAKRLFFCQNIERDKPGSRKHLWPHQFWKDSNPTTKTIRMQPQWRKLGMERNFHHQQDDETKPKTQINRNDQKENQSSADRQNHQIEERWFDYRDILMPDHIWHLILCAKLWPLYWFGLLGIPWLALSILGHRLSRHREHNQLICQCKVQGHWAIKLFQKLNPTWKEDLKNYWNSRNEPEYAELIIQNIDT
jgi:hypothetical protein